MNRLALSRSPNFAVSGVNRSSAFSGYFWDSEDEKTAKSLFGGAWTPTKSERVWTADARTAAQGRSTVDIIVDTAWVTGSVPVGLTYWPDGPVVGVEVVDGGKSAVFRNVPIRDGQLAVMMATSAFGSTLGAGVRVVEAGQGQVQADESKKTPAWVPIAITGGVIAVGVIGLAYITGQIAPFLRVFKR